MFKRLFRRVKLFDRFFKKKKKKYFQLSGEDFRTLTSGGIVKNEAYINGELCEINFCIKEGVEHEEMSSIICENFYKSKWKI